MIDSIKRMSLDLHNTTSNESVRVKRSDTGRKICISLVDGGTPYQITSDCYAVFTAKNAQGNAILHTCTIENNVIVYELKKQATAVPGMLKCEVELYGADDKLITAPKFSILVEDKVYSDGDTEADDGEVSILAGLIKDAASAIANASTAADNANDVAEELREARDNGEFVGEKGDTGKTAYQYAKDGGYTGTESEFSAKLAKEYPTKVSELANDKGYITAAGAPVQSVNGETGAVNLTASDVGARPSSWTPTAAQVGAVPTGRKVNGKALSSDITLSAGDVGARSNTWTPTADEIGAQPKGDYLTEVPDGYATKQFVADKIAEAELGGEKVDLSGYAKKSELPTKVSQLQNDAGYLTEHQDISGKLDASALPTAINTALAQAKASGEFDGQNGTPATHSWNGTTLTITSASGTTSADLKGDKGDTPIMGKDYWTETDKAEIKSYVDEAILGGVW